MRPRAQLAKGSELEKVVQRLKKKLVPDQAGKKGNTKTKEAKHIPGIE